jgi:tetratricopeptide (TPR) repeat protein
MIDETLKLLATWRQRRPAGSPGGELDLLFSALASDPPAGEAYEVEDRIWESWTDHDDPDAVARMNEAIAGIAQRNFEAAGPALDRLVADYPDWAEAWNKRATLRFLAERDADSVADIRRTLELEPRHFGAMSGFAQICLRQGRPDAAVFALQTALEINPFLEAARTALLALQSNGATTMH